MKITFCGAAREVTGSCYLVETEATRLLVDCGMFQGCNLCDVKNYVDFPFDASTVKAVIVTHAHLDHVGRLPKLVKAGFKGKIYATPPTVELSQIVLEDAYRIMLEDQEREKRPPLYGEDDIRNCIKYFTELDYNHDLRIGDLRIRLRDAGHIFGSAFVEIHEPSGPSIIFSGDLGNDGARVLQDTEQLPAIDALIIESTYGNRIHEDEQERVIKLREVITRTAKHRGVLVIPAFAIERTQQLLYEINHLVENSLVPKLDTYLDSPMAIKATKVMRDYPEYYDKEALALISTGDDFLDFPGLKLTPTRELSKMINDAPRPKIIIAGSGMMNGGRIRHHLRRYLSDASTTVLIIGYQAEGTLGRELYDGKRTVKILGDRLTVKAAIASIGAYSAHADQNKLVNWVSNAATRPKKIFCTHGDLGAAVALATRFEQAGIKAVAPRLFETINV